MQSFHPFFFGKKVPVRASRPNQPGFARQTLKSAQRRVRPEKRGAPTKIEIAKKHNNVGVMRNEI
ncbi:hypothetical protein ABEU85_05835 [Heyndrickxia faecalis]|uniref:Uncharacterized protein n=1 Tax=Heyndrickxia faecalis TaxID=2824910 RepID=A0ABV3NIZ5_9BACI|nr:MULTISPECIES: hypothetical protein [Heyndrickxia]MCR4445189.1 hypothetical protein [Heyndrickxia coagulans]MCU6436212.1 hypothetical protein [Heyndrickxia coagulans]MCW8783350.1 hypothetical protein [Heyndrickxia coagulans]MED4902090.1 hypothetical protein [Weizmannia sp. CD-2023]MED4920748.1 hypothetical protein [Weizmannia sp. CD-2023]